MHTARARTRLITGEELARMGDLGPCELVRGEIIPMSPTSWKHGDYVTEAAARLRDFVRPRKLGRVLTGEVGIYTRRDPDNVRGADVVFISAERLSRVQSESYLDVAPELVVEVISPGNTWREMRDKIDEYFGIDVERVWIVEPERQQVLVYRSPTELSLLHEDDTLRGEGVLRDFALPLGELFATAGRATGDAPEQTS
jgi:Uma2 family endonuclease